MKTLKEILKTLIIIEIRRLRKEKKKAKETGDVDAVEDIVTAINELEAILRKVDNLNLTQISSENPLKPIKPAGWS